MREYYAKKAQLEKAEAQKRAEQEKVKEEYQKQLERYAQQKANLKIPDFDDIEADFINTFSKTQQGIILEGSSDPAKLVYALGSNNQKAQELASITNLAQFAFKVAQLETKLKITRRKPSSSPEPRIVGTAQASGLGDNQLNKLRAEAEKTGDYTRVDQYKRSMTSKN